MKEKYKKILESINLEDQVIRLEKEINKLSHAKKKVGD